MKYVSTRSSRSRQTEGERSAAQAIIKGIAEDRGLYVPEGIPRMPENPSGLQGLSYKEVAFRVLSRYLTDYTENELRQCINSAYDRKFEDAEIAPLVRGGDAFFLELFHGPTAAFKDLALSMLPYLLTTALRKERENDRIAILTATSGDTGKAALEGFAGVANTEIIVFYPHVGVSQVQQRQMTTQEGANTHVFGIRGNFDDAQTAVKKIFHDPAMAALLKQRGWQLSSANSINIGRLVPQVVYYVWAYVKLLERGILMPGDFMNVVVPTGNFGNILAAYYARELGIPVGKFICASNRNHVLTDFINTGTYDIRRDFHVTSSPSMDILVSSNLERLLYHLSGSDGEQVAALMKALEEEKHYRAGDDMRVGLTDFYAGFASEEETSLAIRTMYREHHYLMDPHTAVGYNVYAGYRKVTGDPTPTVIAATASAYKFADCVLDAIGLPKTADGFAAIRALHRETGIPVPTGLKGLEDKEVRHQEVLDRDEMADAVIRSLG